MTNRLVEIMKLGQSIWYDNIRRAMLTSGDLAKKIEEDDLRGVTSNPTIFEKAITGSTDYDEQLSRLVQAGKGGGGGAWRNAPRRPQHPAPLREAPPGLARLRRAALAPRPGRQGRGRDLRRPRRRRHRQRGLRKSR